MARGKLNLRHELEYLPILSSDGTLDGALEPGLDDDLSLKMHRAMLLLRRRLHSFRFDNQGVALAEILDEWPGADHHYVKARGEDGNVYILRFDANRSTWELIMFRSVRGEELLR